METEISHFSARDRWAPFSELSPKRIDVTIAQQDGGSEPAWSLPADLADLAKVDSSVIPELVSVFLDDSTTRLETLGSACLHQDFKIVRAQAHSLKGAALQMGASALSSLCAVLELSDRPRMPRSLRTYGEILNEFALVRQAMEKYVVSAEVSVLPVVSFSQDTVK